MPVKASLVAILALGLALGACGRKTALEPPPAATVTNEAGEEVPAPPRPDRPFILDPLI